MAKKVEVIVKPELLIWVRESADLPLDSVARKFKKLKDWETGISRPTIKQLRKLGEIYKRPIAVFYLPEVPKDFQPLRDFRRISN
jgi:hypothetical protein